MCCDDEGSQIPLNYPYSDIRKEAEDMTADLNRAKNSLHRTKTLSTHTAKLNKRKSLKIAMSSTKTGKSRINREL